jgi:uncharacterized membrane protein YkvA (DUF1232 family)
LPEIAFSRAQPDALIARMQKAKAKTIARRKIQSRPDSPRREHEKAAIRSEAFANAIVDAEFYAKDPTRLRALFEEASRKAAAIPKAPFKDSWPYVQAMLRLIRAYYRGEYRNAPAEALLTIIAAVSYLVDPFDLIPDEIPFLGFVDDATVIGFAVARTRQSLDDFMTWETTAL